MKKTHTVYVNSDPFLDAWYLRTAKMKYTISSKEKVTISSSANGFPEWVTLLAWPKLFKRTKAIWHTFWGFVIYRHKKPTVESSNQKEKGSLYLLDLEL